jgi:hypothetical protein
MSQVHKFTYNFKTLTAVMFASLLSERAETEEQKQALMANFEAIADGSSVVEGVATPKFKYKRRSVEVELQLPDELNALVGASNPTRAALITNSIVRVLAEFVKAQYIDNFEPVGAHDLDTIAAVQAASGSRSGVAFSFSEETFLAAVASLQAFLASALGNAAAASSVAAAAKLRFARSAITRSIGLYSEEVLTKVQARVDQWGLWLEENDAENAEEFATVYACWSAALSKQLKADTTVDIASIL